MLDATGSMSAYINESKFTIKEIISSIENRFPKTKFEINYGIVAYRDHSDKNLIEKKNLSNNINEITNFLNSIEATGGDDTPEAVFDGLDEICKINWSKSNSALGGCQRIVFHIADSPPHGK